MPLWANTSRLAHRCNERLACLKGCRFRARLVGAAGAVYFTSGNACEPDAWAFCTPDGTITVPDMRWRAVEGLANRHDLCGE